MTRTKQDTDDLLGPAPRTEVERRRHLRRPEIRLARRLRTLHEELLRPTDTGSGPSPTGDPYKCENCGRRHTPDTGPLNRLFKLFLVQRLLEGTSAMSKARNFARVGAYALMVLWTLMALVGLAAIAWAVWQSLVEGDAGAHTFAALGAGGGDLLLFLFFRPTTQIKRLLADLVQLDMAVNGFQTRVSLELLGFRSRCPTSVLKASDRIGTISGEHLGWIESYFRTVQPSGLGGRLGRTASGEIRAVQDLVTGLDGTVDDLRKRLEGRLGKLEGHVEDVRKALPL